VGEDQSEEKQLHIMSVRNRGWLLIIVHIVGVGGLMMMYGVVSQNLAFILAAFGLQIILGIYSLMLKCPTCGHPIFKQRIIILGMEFTPWDALPPAKCAKCGQDL
jgi:hypothetical protein